MPNRLAETNSPYLLQHAENPVDWYPWGSAAFEKARQLERPIFLSIGYAACHWCHVMAHESFEDEGVAEFLNKHFISIKVDREERPDVDNIYMNAVVSLTGQGGWPLSVFLTPAGEPFYGGTYFPPQRRFNLPSFIDLLQTIMRLWNEDRERIIESGNQVVTYLNRAGNSLDRETPLSQDHLDLAARALVNAYDWKFGGWGQAPKFPQAMAIDFLLRRAAKGDTIALEVGEHALQAMSLGGIYDVVGGGFARYSTDNTWLVPHFEKMLYDNALLARVYLYAYLLTDNYEYRHTCERTLDFISRELTDPQGGFYSSLDADSEDEEGKYYLWSRTELERTIPPELHPVLFASYDIHPDGNFEGRNILQRKAPYSAIASELSISTTELIKRLDEIHDLLAAERSRRIRPATDDKVLAAWNGLALWAFAEAARYLDDSKYRNIAIRNADFFSGSMLVDNRLLRSWRQDRAGQTGLLGDYAAYACGLFSLYQLTHDPVWYQRAQGLIRVIREQFTDPAGGFFDTPHRYEDLIVRPKDLQDNAIPSGGSLAAQAYLLLAGYTNDSTWQTAAQDALEQVISTAAKYPTGFGQWLCAADFAGYPPVEVAITGISGENEPLINVLRSRFYPNSILAAGPYPETPEMPPLLQQRTPINDQATAYVCQNFSCRLPVTAPEDLRNQLNTLLPKI